MAVETGLTDLLPGAGFCLIRNLPQRELASAFDAEYLFCMAISRYAIVGNSGSGKTQLARELAEVHRLPVLDLDCIVWERGLPAVRRADKPVRDDLRAFLEQNPGWVIEGCYGGLIEDSLQYGAHLIFLNPGREICRRRCLNRPHEAHKYATKDEQDLMLACLLEWVEGYYTREDDMSLAYHTGLFDAYAGPKEQRC